MTVGHCNEAEKSLVYGLCITTEGEDLEYDADLNRSLAKGETVERSKWRVGDGYYVSCPLTTRYVALCFCEPDGLSYVPLETVTEETKRDFDALAGKRGGKAGNGYDPFYEWPYCEAIIVDTETFNEIHMTDDSCESEDRNDEVVRKVREKYDWHTPKS